jgi:hypothetical protein
MIIYLGEQKPAPVTQEFFLFPLQYFSVTHNFERIDCETSRRKLFSDVVNLRDKNLPSTQFAFRVAGFYCSFLKFTNITSKL